MLTLDEMMSASTDRAPSIMAKFSRLMVDWVPSLNPTSVVTSAVAAEKEVSSGAGNSTSY